ncbi:hypothetical protein DDR33_11230 [Pararcticibacter amylolyticus]|uniref:Uncharacterized protein n=1 Tax=Pararcticibacter amylolyticus TaxID=2173175 RepID=A0A2U2PGR7_9SPHI|nr:hypothetical protein DDR33_11230 [Pararcticibacter amylolyticus]
MLTVQYCRKKTDPYSGDSMKGRLLLTYVKSSKNSLKPPPVSIFKSVLSVFKSAEQLQLLDLSLQ